MSILQYLNQKPSHYAKIDYDRMPRLYKKYKNQLNLEKVIHIIGTNGKGSTGRWLALMLSGAGFSIGHYTSPHVLEYNERFWKDGDILSLHELNSLHVGLQSLFKKEDLDSLSYFEYSTFLAALAFKDCDFVILEAGLGGEYDATNVFSKQLSIITTIGHDHGDFLGYTLKSIATTKINSITTTAIISEKNEPEVFGVAQKIADKKGVSLKKAVFQNGDKIEKYMEKYHYPDFFLPNIITAFVATKELGITPNMETLKKLDLIGRCQKIRNNITIDVGHNPLSASALVKNFKPKSIVLVYNSFEDKDIDTILSILESVVKEVKILPLKTQNRQMGEKVVIKVLEKLGISWGYFDFNIKEEEEYLVFGSFYVVEEFLRKIDAR